VERQTGIAPEELTGPPMPRALAYVWWWFVELSEARSVTGFGFSPIGFGDIWHWAQLTGRRPLPFEVGLIRRLDRALRASLDG
jgi:hypothetical protein